MTIHGVRAEASRYPHGGRIIVAYCKCGALIGEFEPRYVSRTCDDCKRRTADRCYEVRRGATIPPSVKAAALKRDGWLCRYCGCAVRRRGADRYDMAKETIEFDHVRPVSRGGKSTIENIVVACLGCNRSRGNRGQAA